MKCYHRNAHPGSVKTYLNSLVLSSDVMERLVIHHLERYKAADR